MKALPRVTVHKGNKLIGEFWGPLAERQATDLIPENPALDDRNEVYSVSISDDRCSDCGDVFSAEARAYDADKKHWTCPSCGNGGVPATHDDHGRKVG